MPVFSGILLSFPISSERNFVPRLFLIYFISSFALLETSSSISKPIGVHKLCSCILISINVPSQIYSVTLMDQSFYQ